ncbi:MAG: adenylate/guanylate cyclase domain-containing protein [Rhodospirillaceae bacterium]|nr:adenylate/guanylate cyclase domain-containing protein [Rhodospirillaceae bacterium]
MPRDTFEVYYFQSGRWSVHASFEADQRDLAIEEAKGVEAKLGYPSRVVRATFFEDSNTSEEVVTWQGTKGRKIGDTDSMFGAPPPIAKAPARSAPASAPARRAAEPRPKPTAKAAKPAPRPGAPAVAKVKKKKKRRGTFVSLVISLSVALGTSTVGGAAVALLTIQLQRMGAIGVFDSTPLIFGSFVTLFFVSLLVSLNQQFGLFATLKEADSRSDKSPATQAGPRARRRAAPAQDVEFDGVAVERGETPPAPAEETAPGESEPAAADDRPAELDADMSVSTSAPPEPVAAATAEATPSPAPQAPSADSKPREPASSKSDEKAAAEAQAKQIFVSFAADAQTSASRELGELNAFAKMGLNLYLAGGMSSLGQTRKLGRDSQITVLKQGLQAAGNTPERSAAFCVELPAYGKNPRYAGMIKAGAQAMNKHMAGQPNAAAELGAMLNEWSLPEKRPSVPQVYTFMFTDLVGSTAMTQELGNAEAQKIVRAHNNAVRNALAQYRGREVKHTGDGIMAVFQDAPNAVQATIQMQRDFAEHNASFPNLPLTVRIGLNAGEAVQEENDFFGAAVQMAARVCAQAANGSVWVSQSVVDGCKGQRLGFIPRGQFKMKGIQGARTLYEVAWTEAHKNELADL